MSATRWLLLNTRTRYPIEELHGEPMTEPRGSAVTCPSCAGHRQAQPGVPCSVCGGRGFIRRRAATVRGDTPEAAALALLEAQGFELVECCADLGPGEQPCDECRRDGEESTREGQL